MKNLLTLTTLLLLATLTLTSCGSDEPAVSTTATATYSITFSPDLLDACNVFIIYKAENGRNVQEAVTTPTWTKTVTSNRFPAEFGVQYTFSTKSDAELDKEKYDLQCDFHFEVKTSKGAYYANNTPVLSSTGLARNKVVDYLGRNSGTSTGYRVSENGIVSEAKNLNYNI